MTAIPRSLPFNSPLRLAATLVLGLLLTAHLPGQGPSPEEWLGRAPGIDFQLADWNQIGGWFDRLGESTSTVETRTVGASTEGRPFRICIISSEENLERLDEIKAMAGRIADPRGLEDEEVPSVMEKARPIIFVACNMHSTEIAAAEMSMTLAWRLATSNEELWLAMRWSPSSFRR